MLENLNIKVTTNADKAERAFKSLGNTLTGVGSKFNGANKNLNRLTGAFRNLNMDANRSNKAFNSLGSTLSKINFAAVTYAIYKLSNVLAQAINSAMDMVEVTNLFNVAMGDMAVESGKFLKNMSNVTGLDLTNLMQAVGTYNLLARSMGFSSEQARILSENTTKLALDLSSLANVPFEQALADLKSGLVGQTETVYKYGIDITEASLKQEAMRLGIEKSVRTMTQAEKMALRYSVMIRQTGLAHGDFARTINTPANQLRLLKENFASLARAIGSIFIPILTVLLPIIRGIVMALTDLINLFATFLGFEPIEIKNTTGGFGDMEDAITDAGDSADSLKKKLKDLAAPFDELNALNLDTGSSGGADSGIGDLGGGLSDEFGAALVEYDNLMGSISDKAVAIRDSLLAWLGIMRTINEETGDVEFVFIEGGFVDVLKTAIESEDWYSVGEILGNKINTIFDFLNNNINWDNLGEPITKSISNLAATINGLITAIDWNLIGTTIANGVMVVLNSLNLLFTSINFTGLGRSLADNINGFFNTMDWSIVGETIANGINTAIKFASGFVSTIDLSEIGSSLGRAVQSLVENIDWLNLGNAIANGITAIANGIFNFINEIDVSTLSTALLNTVNTIISETDWTKVGETVTTIIVKLFELLWNLILGLDWAGLIQGVCKIFLGQNISLAKAFNNDFVPYTKEKWNEIKKEAGVLRDDVAAKFEEAGNWIEEKFTNPVKEGLSELWESNKIDVDEVSADINKKFKESADWLDKYFTTPIREDFAETWETTKKDVADLSVDIPKKFEEAKKWIDDKFINPIKEDFKTTWNETKTDAANAIKDIETDFDEATTWLKDKFVTPVTEKFDGLWSNFSSKASTAYTDIKQTFSDIKTWLDTNIAEPIKSTINGILSKVETAINGIIDGINKIKFKAPDWVPFIGGKNFAFNLSRVQLPRLYRGGILEDGQLFQAGEYGRSELVGNYQGRTTVMPLENSGFVESMYKAVYSAVADAQSTGGSVIENVVKLDNEVIYRGQQKVQARKGLSLGNPIFNRG